MSKSKTAEAAAKAVAKSNRKEAVERTPEEIISGARNNASSNLHVTSADILFILSRLDDSRVVAASLASAVASQDTLVLQLRAEITRLNEQNEQFRNVYELENSSASVTVEKVNEAGETKVETTVGINGFAGANGGEGLVAGVAGMLDSSTSGE